MLLRGFCHFTLAGCGPFCVYLLLLQSHETDAGPSEYTMSCVDGWLPPAHPSGAGPGIPARMMWPHQGCAERRDHLPQLLLTLCLVQPRRVCCLCHEHRLVAHVQLGPDPKPPGPFLPRCFTFVPACAGAWAFSPQVQDSVLPFLNSS